MNAKTTNDAWWTLRPETPGKYLVGACEEMAEVITTEGEGLVVLDDRICTLDDFAGADWYGPIPDLDVI